MIVKFNARGKGGSAGPREYLLGKDGNRPHAKLLRGDPTVTSEIIDSSKWAQKYKSGVLSFEEKDLEPEIKETIMDTFEGALMSGLEPSQYSCYWVQHQDKGRLELNFVIATTELTTGKRLQPYYDRTDRQLVNAWKDVVNARFNLSDPNDPARQRTLCTPGNLPRNVKKASETITAGLMAQAEQGLINNRENVIQAISEAGFEVARETKSSISIKNPEGGKNIRLKGALYERSFKFSQELRADIEARSETYQKERGKRFDAARATLREAMSRKREYNRERFQRHDRPFKRVIPTPEQRSDRSLREEQRALRERGVNHQAVQLVRNDDDIHRVTGNHHDDLSLFPNQLRATGGHPSGRREAVRMVSGNRDKLGQDELLQNQIKGPDYERTRKAINGIFSTALAAVRAAVHRLSITVERTLRESDRVDTKDPRYEAAQRHENARRLDRGQELKGPSL